VRSCKRLSRLRSYAYAYAEYPSERPKDRRCRAESTREDYEDPRAATCEIQDYHDWALSEHALASIGVAVHRNDLKSVEQSHEPVYGRTLPVFVHWDGFRGATALKVASRLCGLQQRAEE
jgi:hypothetical protein